ncbi:protein FAM187B-like [Narcine bancroftii]|uniref:protein FAM187B-like n=1 Tax=Narcine bancroftii TaxID=1343680 RepID=UPI0038317CEB
MSPWTDLSAREGELKWEAIRRSTLLQGTQNDRWAEQPISAPIAYGLTLTAVGLWASNGLGVWCTFGSPLGAPLFLGSLGRCSIGERRVKMDWGWAILSLIHVAVWLNAAQPTRAGSSIACHPNRPCQIPFLTSNPATLVCPNGPERPHGVSWVYTNVSEPGPKAAILSGDGPLPGSSLRDLRSRCRFSWPHLTIHSATPGDSGLYLCKAGSRVLSYYEADMQEVDTAHLAGKSVGIPCLPSRFQRVGGQRVEFYTVWNAWEGCDRCGAPGERRRLGFCYARPVRGTDNPVPCGILAWRTGPISPARGPEIEVEPCAVPCHTESPYAVRLRLLELPGGEFVRLQVNPMLLIETHLVNLGGNANLRCPGASVYTPVAWRRNSTDVTRGELAKPWRSAHGLDEATGRAVYKIRGVQKEDEGVYKCYVSEELAASFHLKVVDPFGEGTAAGARVMGPVWSLLAAIALTSTLMAVLAFCYVYWSQLRRYLGRELRKNRKIRKWKRLILDGEANLGPIQRQ